MSANTTTNTNSAIRTSQTSGQFTLNAIDVFRKAVKYILMDWPSLDLAIENGMGGSDARAKRDWMIATLTETMIKSKGDIEVKDFLEDVLDDEFDTIIEDGSLEYNRTWIEKSYKDCSSGKEQDVLFAITQASLKKMSLDKVARPAPVCQTNAGDESESDDTGDEED